jgi:spore coat polysaccharide biosynthesis protein SpsF
MSENTEFRGKKIACIIQARTGSSRLPNKVMMKIKNKTILEHIIDFIKFSKLTNEIIIATTNLVEDDIIEEIGIQKNIKVFRGSDIDVLSRYFFCAEKFNVDIIVRITADNPLIDPNLIDKVINEFQTNKYDYVSNMIKQTFPLGYLVEAFTFSILKKLYRTLTDSENREHVTPDLRKNKKKYRIKNISTPKGLERKTWRLTVDYEEDFELLKIIFDEIYQPKKYIPYESVIKFLDSNKSFLKINQNIDK